MLDEVDLSDDEMDVGDVEPSIATGVREDQVCGGRCLARIAALEETLGRVVTGAPHQYPDQRYCLKDGRYSISITILSP